MKKETIYRIAKEWIEKDHENSQVDWVRLMSEDMERRFNNEFESKFKAHNATQEYMGRLIEMICTWWAQGAIKAQGSCSRKDLSTWHTKAIEVLSKLTNKE